MWKLRAKKHWPDICRGINVGRFCVIDIHAAMASPIKPTSWFLRNSVVDSVPNAVVCSVSLSTVDMQAFHCFYWRLGFCSLLQQRLAGLVEDEPRENSNCSFQSKQLLIGNVSQESYKENTRLQIIEGTRFCGVDSFSDAVMRWIKSNLSVLQWSQTLYMYAHFKGNSCWRENFQRTVTNKTQDCKSPMR